ncbi:unnamed protein product [Anisakis simplex]|uniref:Ku domain-containing protein n=1 Tax=Anisakis simplex TaxID=6269 RepID=A0A0M3K8E0_ANISI|nr:unnamed protein product [Anisakis simplex]
MRLTCWLVRQRGSKPKISLADEVVDGPRTLDDPKVLYPAALLPEMEDDARAEELDEFAVTRLLKELQKS